MTSLRRSVCAAALVVPIFLPFSCRKQSTSATPRESDAAQSNTAERAVVQSPSLREDAQTSVIGASLDESERKALKRKHNDPRNIYRIIEHMRQDGGEIDR